MPLNEDDVFAELAKRPGWERPERGIGERYSADGKRVACIWLDGNDNEVAVSRCRVIDDEDIPLKTGSAVVSDMAAFTKWLDHADKWLDGTLPKRVRRQRNQGVFND